MSQPGAPQPYPPGPQWAPQQPPSSRRAGLVVLVIVLVLVLLGAGGLGTYLAFFKGNSDDGPTVDTSRDLADAAMGCGLFTEEELAPYIPGPFTTEPTDILGGDKDYEKSAQCSYSNQKNRGTGQQLAYVIVTTRMHKANPRESGVDKAKAELRRKPGNHAGVAEADDDKFREIKSSRGNVHDAEISVLYRNVVVSITYHHDGLGENKFTQPLMQLSSLALSKL